MKSLAVVMFFCATAAAAPKLEIVHTAAGSYGAQKVGEDAGPLYAFIKVESDKPDTLTFTDLSVVTTGGKTSRACAKLQKLDRIAAIAEIKSTRGLLRIDADKGTPFTGKIEKGTTWLRIDAVMDHQCKTESAVVVWFANDKTPIQVQRAVDEHLPS